jgi:uncharacterized protein YcbK (DUF882 family)
MIVSAESPVIASRRGFLKTVAGFSLLPLSGIDALNAGTESKTLPLKNIHTSDKLKLTYFEQADAMLDQLYDLKLALGTDKPFLVSSGYRSPRTNAGLRKNLTKYNLHIQGRAIDLHMDGLKFGSFRTWQI